MAGTTIEPDIDVDFEFTDEEWGAVIEMLEQLEQVERKNKERNLHEFNPKNIVAVRETVEQRDSNFLIFAPEEFVILSDASLEARNSINPERDVSDAMLDAQHEIKDRRKVLNEDKLKEQVNKVLDSLFITLPTT